MTGAEFTPRGAQASRIVVTGATGFVGKTLAARLTSDHNIVRCAVRERRIRDDRDAVVVGEIGPATDWSQAVNGMEVVLHLAARVHVLRDRSIDPLAAFRAVNVVGTRRLAEQAAAAGVRRLVYVSSVKVHGESTPAGAPFRASDPCAPVGAYGRSKAEAEMALQEVSARTGLEIVVIRPPLVYGPGVKGNYARLLNLVYRGVPLPLARIDNRRSLVALDSLVDLLVRCVTHPRAAGKTFLVSDQIDLSTPELIRMMAAAMGVPARLLPTPISWLRTAAGMVGRLREIERLVGTLQVDIRDTCETLDWAPPVSVQEGVRRAASAFLATR